MNFLSHGNMPTESPPLGMKASPVPMHLLSWAPRSDMCRGPPSRFPCGAGGLTELRRRMAPDPKLPRLIAVLLEPVLLFPTAYSQSAVALEPRQRECWFWQSSVINEESRNYSRNSAHDQGARQGHSQAAVEPFPVSICDALLNKLRSAF